MHFEFKELYKPANFPHAVVLLKILIKFLNISQKCEGRWGKVRRLNEVPCKFWQGAVTSENSSQTVFSEVTTSVVFHFSSKCAHINSSLTNWPSHELLRSTVPVSHHSQGRCVLLILSLFCFLAVEATVSANTTTSFILAPQASDSTYWRPAFIGYSDNAADQPDWELFSTA